MIMIFNYSVITIILLSEQTLQFLCNADNILIYGLFLIVLKYMGIFS